MNCCVNDIYDMECYVLSDCVLSNYHIVCRKTNEVLANFFLGVYSV